MDCTAEHWQPTWYETPFSSPGGLLWKSDVCFPNFKGAPPPPLTTHPTPHHLTSHYIYISCNVMYHKGEFITCHYLSLWHPRWHLDPQRGHFTAVDFSVYVCTFAVFFSLYQLPQETNQSATQTALCPFKLLTPLSTGLTFYQVSFLYPSSRWPTLLK